MRSLALYLFLLTSVLLSGCSMFKEEVADPDSSVEELYARAQQSMANENWAEAVERLRELEAKYPYGLYAEQAQLDTIFAYNQNGEPGLAIAAADRFIKLHPTHESVDYAYYLKGVSSFEEDKSTLGYLTGKHDLSDRDPQLTLDALNAFRDVYTLFPDSRYAPRARERVRYLTNTLAKHEIGIATYYYTHGANVAVVNRAKGVIEEYPGTPQVEQALALLMRSYQKMGLDDLSRDSERVLALNFPDSPYLSPNMKITSEWKGMSEDGDEGDADWFSSLRNKYKVEAPAG